MKISADARVPLQSIPLNNSSSNNFGGNDTKKTISTGRTRFPFANVTNKSNVTFQESATHNNGKSLTSKSTTIGDNKVLAGRGRVERFAKKKSSTPTVVKPSTQKSDAVINPFKNAITVDNLSKGNSSPHAKNVKTYDSPATLVDNNSDALKQDDPLYATVYADDIHNSLRNTEHLSMVSPFYMDKQDFLSGNKRAILVDWLVRIQPGLFSDSALHLAVNLIDRFLETLAQPISVNEFQLLGATCLLIASKYEDIDCVEIRDLVHSCDNQYPFEKFLVAEHTILKTLGYRISHPTALSFLDLYLTKFGLDESASRWAHFILDSTLQRYDMLQYRPSQLAAAAILVADINTSDGTYRWSPFQAQYTGYKEQDLHSLAKSIAQNKNGHLQAVRIKYDLMESI